MTAADCTRSHNCILPSPVQQALLGNIVPEDCVQTPSSQKRAQTNRPRAIPTVRGVQEGEGKGDFERARTARLNSFSSLSNTV